MIYSKNWGKRPLFTDVNNMFANLQDLRAGFQLGGWH